MPRPLVDSLDLAVDRLVGRALPGERRGAGVGSGLELSQIRPYQSGDDIRHLDPAATARSAGQLHIRLRVPERSMTTWLILDASASMAFGTALRLKADVAEGVVSAFGRLGVRRAGSVALVAFGDGGIRVLPPRASKPGLVALRRVCAEGVCADGVHDAGGLAEALRRVSRLAGVPGLVIVVSDFREQAGWERPLGSLRLRHAVLAVEITDPREGEVPDVGQLAVIDPETGARLRVDTSSAKVRQRFAELETERRAHLARELRRLRVRQVTLSTGSDWLRDLGRGLGVRS